MLAGARRRKQEYDKVQGVATTVKLWRTRVLMLLVVSLHTAFADALAISRRHRDKTIYKLGRMP